MLKHQTKILIFFLTFCISYSLFLKSVFANGAVLGIHLLQPEEINQVRRIFEDDVWRYITIPLTIDDIHDWGRWQKFFNSARQQQLIPIIRLATHYNAEQDYWTIPNRREIVDLVNFLSSLNWHSKERLVIVFNEVNHAKEWGGKIDPFAYTYVLKFTSQWLRSENLNYKILPAAMDLAAIDAFPTMEAFNYLETMYRVDPEVFSYIDYWNSHSYPNPDFSASPKRLGQNSLRGFEYELNYLSKKSDQYFQVFITETGWVNHYLTNFYLSNYYFYALENIWNDERVLAVTPFVMKGAPGSFANFSFLDANDKLTVHAFAVKKALQQLSP